MRFSPRVEEFASSSPVSSASTPTKRALSYLRDNWRKVVSKSSIHSTTGKTSPLRFSSISSPCHSRGKPCADRTQLNDIVDDNDLVIVSSNLSSTASRVPTAERCEAPRIEDTDWRHFTETGVVTSPSSFLGSLARRQMTLVQMSRMDLISPDRIQGGIVGDARDVFQNNLATSTCAKDQVRSQDIASELEIISDFDATTPASSASNVHQQIKAAKGYINTAERHKQTQLWLEPRLPNMANNTPTVSSDATIGQDTPSKPLATDPSPIHNGDPSSSPRSDIDGVNFDSSPPSHCRTPVQPLNKNLKAIHISERDETTCLDSVATTNSGNDSSLTPVVITTAQADAARDEIIGTDKYSSASVCGQSATASEVTLGQTSRPGFGLGLDLPLHLQHHALLPPLPLSKLRKVYAVDAKRTDDETAPTRHGADLDSRKHERVRVTQVKSSSLSRPRPTVAMPRQRDRVREKVGRENSKRKPEETAQGVARHRSSRDHPRYSSAYPLLPSTPLVYTPGSVESRGRRVFSFPHGPAVMMSSSPVTRG